LLPKNHKDISLFADLPQAQSEPKAFASDQMMRCDECLRANPPTRGACLYCGAALGKSLVKAEPPKPQLRPLEKWEHGFNNILIGRAAAQFSQATMEQAAALVKLNSADLARIINSETPLPVARAANRDEAELIQQSLEPLGLQTRILSDESLGQNPPQRLRTVDMFPETLALHPTSGEPTVIAWSDLTLMVTGRLFEKQVEVKEQRRAAQKAISLMRWRPPATKRWLTCTRTNLRSVGAFLHTISTSPVLAVPSRCLQVRTSPS